MATANINWAFGPRVTGAPVANCTFSVQVMRDGIALAQFTVTTGSSGTASGVYQDSTVALNRTYQYRLVPIMAGCAANCTADYATVNWSCAGIIIPPPPPPPITTGCPDGQNAFYVHNACNSTQPSQQVANGAAVFISQNFTDATAVTITPAVPGLTVTTAAAGTGMSASLSGNATTAGTYNVQFTATKTGCANCVITYPLIVGAGASTTQTIQVLQNTGGFNPNSGQVPVNPQTFNSGDQTIQALVVGPPGQTFKLVIVGTDNFTSPPITIPSTGRYDLSFLAGARVGYSATWSIQPATDNTTNPPSTPITLTNPGSTTITGDTSLVLAVTQTTTSFSITVTSPPGTVAVPFTLYFGGKQFNNSSSNCLANSFGVINSALNTGLGNTPGRNVCILGPFDISSFARPYTAAFKLTTTAGTSQYHNVVSGAPCVEISIA